MRAKFYDCSDLEGGCGEEGCQECCPHNEFDHDCCMDCGYERDPGEAIDRAMDYLDQER